MLKNIYNLIKVISNYNICSGIKRKQAKQAFVTQYQKLSIFFQNSSVSFHQVTFNHSISCVLWWWIVFTVSLTDERRLALFPAGTIVRDPHHRESPTRREQGLNLLRTEFRLSWMKLCSSDNHYTTAPSCVLLIDKPNESFKNKKTFERNTLSTKKRL